MDIVISILYFVIVLQIFIVSIIASIWMIRKYAKREAVYGDILTYLGIMFANILASSVEIICVIEILNN